MPPSIATPRPTAAGGDKKDALGWTERAVELAAQDPNDGGGTAVADAAGGEAARPFMRLSGRFT